MSQTAYDAVVIGAGHNGLVAANRLADAGWSVLVLEAQPEIGGAVRTAQDVHPDFRHDTFSAFYPLGVASPALRSLRLEEHGLVWRHPPAALGHPLPDGGWALIHRDRHVTAALMDEQHPGDGDAWLALCASWDAIGDHLVGAMLSPFPPVRHGLGALAGLRRAGGAAFLHDVATPVSELARQRFGGPAPALLLTGNAGHADIPLTSPGSALFALLMTMLGQTVGFPCPEGGAGAVAEALARRLATRGGEIESGTEVVRVEVEGGRARGVRTLDGSYVSARRAVIADVVAPRLFGGGPHGAGGEGLVAEEHLPARVVRGMRRFRMDPATVKVDWALSGPVPWSDTPAYAPGTVHVADSVAEIMVATQQVEAGRVPERPFLLTGQMTTADPTRSPAGTEAMWAYTHVPQSVADGVDGHDGWEWFADRMQARIEERAPGFGDRVIARRVLGPPDLEARNGNLIGGAVGGGSAQLDQELVFRPVPGLGRAETGVPGLYLGSSSAHPGGGVHGAPGMNAARAALLHDRLRRLTRR